ncbi:MAG TPA: PHP domain-containing protein, partial [Candidatus Methylacidiphilales bacterium]|nr:PHP domain-containing protein [Candidatus Methylacidiphilales bacterium]
MIVHLDADAFYASVEQASDPRLRGKAIAVGGARRGIIASASYEARRQGVFTPMPTARAMKVCPRLIVVPGDFDKYEYFSKMMFSYVYDFTPEVEVQGIDEGYFSLRGTRQNPESVAETVRRAINESLKITVSEGVASNKLVSQVASKYRKPNNLTHVPMGTERQFLSGLPNAWLPGIGARAAQTLNAAGLTQIGQIALAGPDQLSLIVGAIAPQLCQFAHGIDDRPVRRESAPAKSYGSQETFDQDQTDEPFIVAKLRSITDHLMAKVRADRKMIRTVTVKVRYNDMEEEQRSQSLCEPTSYEGDLYSLLYVLLKKAWTRRVSLRLVSVKLSGVYDALFEDELGLDHVMGQGKKLDLSATVDRIRHDFGNLAIMRGHDLWLRHKKSEMRQEAEGRAGNGCGYMSGTFVGGATDGTASASSCSSARRIPRIASCETAIYGPGTFLNFKSCYSFMDSLLRPREIVKIAKDNGARAVAMTDPNLHGLVEFCNAARKAEIRPIIAAELQIDRDRHGVGRPYVNAYVENEVGYTNLCALLSEEKLTVRQIEGRSAGLILVPTGQCGPEIRYAAPGDRGLFMIVQSIRTLTLLKDQHPNKRKGHFHFRGELFAGPYVEAILERCHYQPQWGGLRFPCFKPDDGSTPRDFLRRLTMEGARRRYGARFFSVEAQLKMELELIATVGYEEYFLLTHQLLNECKAMGIRWITRGSAADSLVCYCLNISDVCPIRFELYFKRFLNADRMKLNKLPDIDIDFAHDRRDEVVEMVLKKYGSRAAIVGGFQTYQGRSALADISKVLGVSESQIRRLTERIPRTSALDVAQAVSESIECEDLTLDEDPYKTALAMAHRLDGFPRHPKMHPCGIVLSRDPIHRLTPTFISTKNWPTTHFDMDSVEAVGLVKMDLLCQAGLSVMRDTINILSEQGTDICWETLEALEPWENDSIWEMISRGKNRGVHHIESPAMLTLARMCGVHKIDDLIAVVSVIRPGAANTMKKEQFARRCLGTEEPDYTHPSLATALKSTYGVVAYEEHILQICEAFADMSPGRSDMLRRALVKADILRIEEMLREFVETARKYGRTEREIKAVSELIIGFKGYAFCRAHSTAYGVEAYQAAYLKL